MTVLAHPEHPSEVVAEAIFAGWTAGVPAYVERHKAACVVLMTECSMSDNVALQHPDVEFIRPCNLCPHMKRITLANIRESLEQNRHVVSVDAEFAGQEQLAVERMIAV
ncbi:quinolinate synthase [Bradyrhizobium sp. USDA 3650]